MRNKNNKKNSQGLNYEYMLILSEKYTRSLIKSGYPTNTHVYDINLTYLKTKLPHVEAVFLLKIRRFFSSLSFLQGMILVNDYLEKDKNYQYWWLDYGNEDFINRERKKLECKLKPRFKYLIAE